MGTEGTLGTKGVDSVNSSLAFELGIVVVSRIGGIPKCCRRDTEPGGEGVENDTR